MSTRIAYDLVDNVAALYDSVTGIAFGQVFEGGESYEDAERFLAWLPEDARICSDLVLEGYRQKFAETLEGGR